MGNNVKKLDEFENEIKMWVFEEEINGRKLSEIINTDHENVKYLPGHKIPENVVSSYNEVGYWISTLQITSAVR